MRTAPTSIRNYFERQQSSLVTLEVGTHSPWIDRELNQAGHEILIANARKVSLIHGDSRKNDRLGAEKLARPPASMKASWPPFSIGRQKCKPT